jgi:hypothetical protein
MADVNRQFNLAIDLAGFVGNMPDGLPQTAYHYATRLQALLAHRDPEYPIGMAKAVLKELIAAHVKLEWPEGWLEEAIEGFEIERK